MRSERKNPTQVQRWEWVTLIAVLLIAFFIRTAALTETPPGLRYDELLNYRMAERVMHGDYPIYFRESWGHEPLFHYAQALAMGLGGQNAWSLRIAAPIFGVLEVLTAWLAARRLFGARIAAVSAAALSVSFWSVFFSRQGSRVIAITPLSCLMVYFLWRGYERLSSNSRQASINFILGGLFLGLGMYVYVAGRVLPLLVAGFAVYLMVLHRQFLLTTLKGLALLLLVGALVSAPLFLYLHRNPDAEQRLDQLGGPREALKQGNPGPVAFLTSRALAMFISRGQENWLYNVSGRPVFDPVTAACFVVGLMLSIWKWKRPKHMLLLIWFGIGISPAVIVPPAGSLSHSIAAQPPAYVLAAIGVEGASRFISRRGSRISSMLALAVVAIHGALSARAYFFVWTNAPQVRELYQAGITAIAEEIDHQKLSGPVAVGAPYVNYWNPWNTLAFNLASNREHTHVRWFNPAAAWVWPSGSGPATIYLPNDPLGPQTFEDTLQKLFAPDAHELQPRDEDFTAFQISRPKTLTEKLGTVGQLDITWSTDLAHLQSPTLPLNFGDRFAFLGAEIPTGAVVAGDIARVITYWEAKGGDNEPVVAFAHVTSDGQDIWGQYDGLEVRPDSLQPGDRFAHVYTISLSPETPQGVYHMQIGFYHPDTLERVPIRTSETETADRVWIAELVVRRE